MLAAATALHMHVCLYCSCSRYYLLRGQYYSITYIHSTYIHSATDYWQKCDNREELVVVAAMLHEHCT